MVSVIVRFVKDTFLHLYDHTIKPILTYGSEIWGMFSVDSSSCRKKSDYCFEIFFSTSQTEQSHVKKIKIHSWRK